MPLSLLNHSALALFAQRTRIPTSARSIGFCAIWVCISSSSSTSKPRSISFRISGSHSRQNFYEHAYKRKIAVMSRLWFRSNLSCLSCSFLLEVKRPSASSHRFWKILWVLLHLSSSQLMLRSSPECSCFLYLGAQIHSSNRRSSN